MAMERFLWICLAGALGSGARYLVSGWVQERAAVAFPAGTLAVNVSGSFLIACILHVGMNTTVLAPGLRVALVTGFVGGFTTYSAFNYETTRLLEENQTLLASLNVAATFVGCFVAGLLGRGLGKWMVGD